MPLFGRKKPSVPQEMPIAVAVGKKTQLSLYENRIRVTGDLERDIYISSIATVALGPAGRFTDGWILFRTSTGPHAEQLMFNRKQQPAFEHLRDELNKLIARQSTAV